MIDWRIGPFNICCPVDAAFPIRDPNAVLAIELYDGDPWEDGAYYGSGLDRAAVMRLRDLCALVLADA